MKLLFVTCLKEHQRDVAKILDQSGIAVFSVTETVGFKDEHEPDLLESWFASERTKFDSVFVFSFTDEQNANTALNRIAQYNETHKTGFPVRGFIVPVEKSTYALAQ